MSTTWNKGMAADSGDTSWWVAGAGLAGAAFAWVLRGMGWARNEGKFSGQLSEWQQRIEESIKTATIDRMAIEARFNIQVTALNVRNERVDDVLRHIASREEMNDSLGRSREEMNNRFTGLERQISDLSAFVHNTRGRDGGGGRE